MSHDVALNDPILEIISRYEPIKSVLDIGAGDGSWGHLIRAGLCRKVDMVAIEKYLDNCSKLYATGIYCNVVHADALNALDHFDRKGVDVVLASQVIEHLEKEDGLKLIDIMKELASKLVIVATPRGYMPVSAENNPNKYEKHLSGWNEADFRRLGFETQVLDMRSQMNRSVRLVDTLRRKIFRLYDPHQIIAVWSRENDMPI